MTVTKTAKSGPPRTLMQAHEELVCIRPCRKASLTVWLSYHQQSAAVYEQIAKTDPGHEGEALYWVARERAHARRIEARIRVLIPEQ
ncbi:MAG: AMED_5909 family protein [Pseudonocardiaceae bacterium]